MSIPKVLLVNVWYLKNPHKPGGWLSLGLPSIANHLRLKTDAKVEYIDCLREDNFMSKVEEKMKHADIVGFSVMTSQVYHALRLTRTLANRNPKPVIVWGGAHPSVFPECLREERAIDYMVRGPGEYCMEYLVKQHERRREIFKDAPPGLYWLNDNGDVEGEGVGKILNDEDYITIDYEAIGINPICEDHIIGVKSDRPLRLYALDAGRGCPWRCAFCINVVANKRQRRNRKAEDMVEEMEHAIERYSIEYVDMYDEEFFVNKKRVIRFCELMIEKGLKVRWGTTTRSNYFHKSYLGNRDIQKLLLSSGLCLLNIGAESGSDDELRRICKDQTVEILRRSFEIVLRDMKIALLASFIAGMPGQTPEDLRKTIDLILEYRKYSNFYTQGPQIYRPYPGGDLYLRALELGLKVPTTLEGWGELDYSGDNLVPLEAMPWLFDRKMVSAVNVYLPLVVNPRRKKSRIILAKPALYIFKLLAILRIKAGFYKGLIDLSLFNYLRSKFGVR